MLASCAKIGKPPASYGAVLRAERGNGIRYDWMQWMVERGGSVVKDPENGDFTVTVNSAQNKASLDHFIEVAKKCGPPNPGSIGQGDVIQLLATGKALQAQLVLAAWANFQDPKKSAVVGKLDVVPLPRAADGIDRRRDRQLELRDRQGHQRRAAEGGARVRQMVHQLRRAVRVRQGRWHSESFRRARLGSCARPGLSLDAGVCGDAEDGDAGARLCRGSAGRADPRPAAQSGVIGEMSSGQGAEPRGAGDQRHVRQEQAPDRRSGRRCRNDGFARGSARCAPAPAEPFRALVRDELRDPRGGGVASATFKYWSLAPAVLVLAALTVCPRSRCCA